MCLKWKKEEAQRNKEWKECVVVYFVLFSLSVRLQWSERRELEAWNERKRKESTKKNKTGRKGTGVKWFLCALVSILVHFYSFHYNLIEREHGWNWCVLQSNVIINLALFHGLVYSFSFILNQQHMRWKKDPNYRIVFISMESSYLVVN